MRKNYCFACGPHNKDGLRLKFIFDPASKRAQTTLRISTRYQGATGYAHGGIIATLLDEAMAKANGLAGIRAVTALLTISYRKMVPLRKELRLAGWRTGKRGRRLFLKSELRMADVLLAEAHGTFVEVNEAR